MLKNTHTNIFILFCVTLEKTIAFLCEHLFYFTCWANQCTFIANAGHAQRETINIPEGHRHEHSTPKRHRNSMFSELDRYIGTYSYHINKSTHTYVKKRGLGFPNLHKIININCIVLKEFLLVCRILQLLLPNIDAQCTAYARLRKSKATNHTRLSGLAIHIQSKVLIKRIIKFKYIYSQLQIAV